jgi:regulator of RNase E activity RraA
MGSFQRNNTEQAEDSEISILQRLLSLYTPVISDVLDQLGTTDNAMLWNIRPIYEEARMAGPVFTVTEEFHPGYKQNDDLYHIVNMLEAVRPTDVIVIATGGRLDAAVWGELMSNAARNVGAVGVVTDGAVRDLPLMLSMNPRFPVFSAGVCPADALGRCRIADFGKPIRCGGLRIYPHDFLLADRDGVVVIPKEKIRATLELAETKVGTESEFRNSLRDGMKVSAAYAKYKIM